ncbi:MAG: hypothetical protein Q9180_001678, partial [Flavoplaca navasiana]
SPPPAHSTARSHRVDQVQVPSARDQSTAYNKDIPSSEDLGQEAVMDHLLLPLEHLPAQQLHLLKLLLHIIFYPDYWVKRRLPWPFLVGWQKEARQHSSTTLASAQT